MSTDRVRKSVPLVNKVAVVTGASQGLGQYLAIALARESAKVVLAARNAERIAAVAATIAGSGGTARAIPTDLTNERDCDTLVETTLAEFGSIDILVLNAGSATDGRLEELDDFAPIRSAMEVGRTFLGPDGAHHRFDLSPGRENDIKRVPASTVADKVVGAIVDRRREIDLSPGIQKLATRVRPFLPGPVDRRILKRATQMRRAFDAEFGQRDK